MKKLNAAFETIYHQKNPHHWKLNRLSTISTVIDNESTF